MRKRAKPLKKKVQELRKVLDEGIDAVVTDGLGFLDRITTLFILPGNGRSKDQPIGESVSVSGTAMTIQEYHEWRASKGLPESDTAMFEVTVGQETIVRMSKAEYERPAQPIKPIVQPEPQTSRKAKRSKEVKPLAPATVETARKEPEQAAAIVKELWTWEELRDDQDRQPGQTLVRRFKIG
jgi:hypothetical protein